MDGFKLDDFCKHFKTVTKNEMDHSTARLLLLRQFDDINGDYKQLLTEFFNYAVQDITVLIELVNASHVIDNVVELCKELQCSLRMILQ